MEYAHSGCLEASYGNIAIDQRRNDGSLDLIGVVEGSEIHSAGPDDGLTVKAKEQKKFPNITPRILACTAKWKTIPILRSFGGSPGFQGQDYEF